MGRLKEIYKNFSNNKAEENEILKLQNYLRLNTKNNKGIIHFNDDTKKTVSVKCFKEYIRVEESFTLLKTIFKKGIYIYQNMDIDLILQFKYFIEHYDIYGNDI